MKGVILKKGELYYTYMSKIFKAINNVQKNYNWFITDCVCYPQTKQYDKIFSEEYRWLTGEDLTNIVEKEDFQWIWGVLHST